MKDKAKVAEELYALGRALVGRIARRRSGQHGKEDAIY